MYTCICIHTCIHFYTYKVRSCLADWHQFCKHPRTLSVADDEQDHGDEEVVKCQDCSDKDDPDLELAEFPPDADDV